MKEPQLAPSLTGLRDGDLPLGTSEVFLCLKAPDAECDRSPNDDVGSVTGRRFETSGETGVTPMTKWNSSC